MDRVILCAGRHVRIESICGNMPKCLLSLCGTVILDRIFSNLELICKGNDKTFVVIRGEHLRYFVEFFRKFPKWKGEIVIDRMVDVATPTSSLISLVDQLGEEISEYIVIHYGDTFCECEEFLGDIISYPERSCVAVGSANENNLDSRRVVVEGGVIQNVLDKSSNHGDLIPRWGGVAYIEKVAVSTFCPIKPLIEEIFHWSERSNRKVRCAFLSVLYNINSPEIYLKLNREKYEQ